MSLLKNLSPAKGSKHYPKRVGRGIGSGMGGTSTKGHKGQLARTGGKVRRGFEGGQTPLMRRLPKFGFSNISFENRYSIVKLSSLEGLGTDINPEVLKEKGILKNGKVKILAGGAIKSKFTVKAHKFSKGAREAIEAAGGRVEEI